MSERLRDKPFVWVTWLAALLSGEHQCTYAAWYKAHVQYRKRPDPTFDSVGWKEQHAALVRQRAIGLVDDGFDVDLENENAFRLHGASATLAGKPDMIARRGGYVRIVDAKTGAQREKDFWQVVIYLYAAPRVWPELRSKYLVGELCYAGMPPIEVSAGEVTADRVRAIGAMVTAIATAEPAPVPSAAECRFCDVDACTARIATDVPAATVDAW